MSQLIYVFNAIGHCGHFFSWALHDALGYNYFSITKKDKEFQLSGNLDVGRFSRVTSWYLANCMSQDEWNYVITTTNMMKDKGKHMFHSQKINTLIVQNEFRSNFFVNSDDPSIVCLLPNGNTYFERVNITRFDRQEIFEPPVAIPALNKHCIEINLEDMIFNKEYNFVEHLMEPVDVDKLHTNMLYCHDFILEKGDCNSS